MANAKATENVIIQSFNLWKGAVPAFNFIGPTTGSIDIAVKVDKLSDADTVASTTPEGTVITINNQVSFAAGFKSETGNQTGLLNTLAHEIGHALGLNHSTTPNSIMWAVGNDNVETLQADDTAGVRALYGWKPQARVSNFGTHAGPALCACGNTLAMVWRGSGDNNIWISTSTDGTNWTPQRPFRDVGTLGSPDLAWINDELWMVWRGSPDQALFYKKSRDFFVKDNPPQANIKGVGSSHGPRIAGVNKTPTLVWKGIKGDGGIYYSRFVGGQWLPQAKIAGVGTENSPVALSDAGGVRLLWRGVDKDHVLYTTTGAADFTGWKPQAQVQWTRLGNGNEALKPGTPGSDGAPTMAANGGTIFAAWRGVPGDQGLYYTQFRKDPGQTSPTWSGQANIPNVGSSDGPSMAYFNGKLYLAWKGIEGDSGIYMTSQ
jgi:Matrixin